MPPRQLRVVVRVASGPRRGFGHAVRALRVAGALRASVWICPDGPMPGALAPARHVTLLSEGVRALDQVRPDLLLLDTPVVADGRRWLAAARRRGIPVASIHDRGIAPLASDVAIDGSLAARGGIAGARRSLIGPRFMVMDSQVRGRGRSAVDERLVVIALGGGPRIGLARRLAHRIVELSPEARVVIAAGFAVLRHGSAPSRHGVEWLGPQASLATVLGRSAVAVVAGGVTLYEAAALGVPTVAVPIVEAQRATVRAFGMAGAAIVPEVTMRVDADAVARAVTRLLNNRRLGGRIGRRGRQLVDGRGTERVVRALCALAGRGR